MNNNEFPDFKGIKELQQFIDDNAYEIELTGETNALIGAFQRKDNSYELKDMFFINNLKIGIDDEGVRIGIPLLTDSYSSLGFPIGAANIPIAEISTHGLKQTQYTVYLYTRLAEHLTVVKNLYLVAKYASILNAISPNPSAYATLAIENYIKAIRAFVGLYCKYNGSYRIDHLILSSFDMLYWMLKNFNAWKEVLPPIQELIEWIIASDLKPMLKNEIIAKVKKSYWTFDFPWFERTFGNDESQKPNPDNDCSVSISFDTYSNSDNFLLKKD